MYSKQQIARTGLLSFKLLLANYPTGKEAAMAGEKLFASNT